MAPRRCAPVDSIGCERLANANASQVPRQLRGGLGARLGHQWMGMSTIKNYGFSRGLHGSYLFFVIFLGVIWIFFGGFDDLVGKIMGIDKEFHHAND